MQGLNPKPIDYESRAMTHYTSPRYEVAPWGYSENPRQSNGWMSLLPKYVTIISQCRTWTPNPLIMSQENEPLDLTSVSKRTLGCSDDPRQSMAWMCLSESLSRHRKRCLSVLSLTLGMTLKTKSWCLSLSRPEHGLTLKVLMDRNRIKKKIKD